MQSPTLSVERKTAPDGLNSGVRAGGEDGTDLNNVVRAGGEDGTDLNNVVRAGGEDGTFSNIRQYILPLLGMSLLLVGLVPFLFIIWLIPSTGANNICVDYAAFLHVVDKVLSGQYQWSSIFSDSFIRTHMVLLPVLVHIAVAYTTKWNVTSELYLGMVFHLFRALMISDMLVGRSAKWIRAAVTGVVLSLVFATSQTCIMIYGEASIAIGLCLFGFTFALWSLCRFGRTPRGLLLMLVGGVASSYSFGNFVPCWLTLLAALLFLPVRPMPFAEAQPVRRNDDFSQAETDTNYSDRQQRKFYLVNRRVAFTYWLIGALLSCAPYAYFLMNRSVQNPELTKTFGLFPISFLLNSLGRPLAKDMGLVYGKLPGAEVNTFILLGLVVALAVPIVAARLKPCLTTRISALLFLYGLSSVWTVGIVRTHVAPWYAAMSLYCWIAIAGLGIAYVGRALSRDGETKSCNFAKIGFLATGSVALGTILVLYLANNLSYRDKQFFLNARAPVSAEYLRNYTNAPTFLESTIFSNDGRPDRILSFAGVLKRHELCVFSPEQSWSLQGQYALANVAIKRTTGSSRVAWVEGKSNIASNWRDYHHLNLNVPDGNVVEWRFNVPSDATEAFFITSVCAPSNSSKAVSTISLFSGAPHPVTSQSPNSFQTSTDANGASYVTCCEDHWRPIQLNLLPYRGKSVMIRLGGSSLNSRYRGITGTAPGSVLYMYPRVDLSLKEHGSAAALQTSEKKVSPVKQEALLCPSNMDLSPLFPREYVRVIHFPEVDSADWKDVDIGLSQDPAAKTFARFWDVQPERNIVVDDSDYLMMQLEPLPGKSWCSLKMHLQFDDGTTDGFSMPLFPDNQAHLYVYPVKLLTAKTGAKLTRVLTFASAVEANSVRPYASTHGAPGNSEPAEVRQSNSPILSNSIRISNVAFIKTIDHNAIAARQ